MNAADDATTASLNSAVPRRTFLKATGLTAVGVAAQSLIPDIAGAAASSGVRSSDVEHDGKMFRVNTRGQVLVSSDSGRTWKLHSDLGPQRPVKSLSKSGSALRAHVAQQNNPFRLELTASGIDWRSIHD